MSHCQATLSPNAGVAIHLGSMRLWSDAVHDRRVVGFSTVTPERWTVLQAHPDFASPDVIFFTHCHPDHYSRAMTEQAVARYPNVALVLPEQEFDRQLVLSGPSSHLTLEGLHMDFVHLTHEGEQYRDVPHYGCIAEYGGFRVLIAGDCAVGDPRLADLLRGRHIDLALVNFPWVTLRKGRHFIEEAIRPDHLMVYHLPFPHDDRWGYRDAAVKGAAQVQGVPDVRLLLEPFQREILA